MFKWILIFACFWWLGRLVFKSLAALSRLGRPRKSGDNPGADASTAGTDKPRYDDLTKQKISDADFEELKEE